MKTVLESSQKFEKDPKNKELFNNILSLNTSQQEKIHKQELLQTLNKIKDLESVKEIILIEELKQNHILAINLIESIENISNEYYFPNIYEIERKEKKKTIFEEFTFNSRTVDHKIMRLDHKNNFDTKKILSQFDGIPAWIHFISLCDYNQMVDMEDPVMIKTFLLVMKFFQKEKKIFFPRRLSLYLLSFAKQHKYDPKKNKLLNNINDLSLHFLNSKFHPESKIVYFDISGCENMIKKQPFRDFFPEFDGKEHLEEIVQFLKNLIMNQVKNHHDQPVFILSISSTDLKNIRFVFEATRDIILRSVLDCVD